MVLAQLSLKFTMFILNLIYNTLTISVLWPYSIFNLFIFHQHSSVLIYISHSIVSSDIWKFYSLQKVRKNKTRFTKKRKLCKVAVFIKWGLSTCCKWVKKYVSYQHNLNFKCSNTPLGSKVQTLSTSALAGSQRLMEQKMLICLVSKLLTVCDVCYCKGRLPRKTQSPTTV